MPITLLPDTAVMVVPALIDALRFTKLYDAGILSLNISLEPPAITTPPLYDHLLSQSIGEFPPPVCDTNTYPPLTVKLPFESRPSPAAFT